MKLEFKEITKKEEWDQFVYGLKRYTFVQSWGFTEVLESIVNRIVRLGIYEDGKLIGLLPLGIIRAKRGKYLRMRHGPILLESKWNLETLEQIRSFLSQFAKKENLDFVRIQPVMNDPEIIEASGFRSAPTHNLDAEHTLQLKLQNPNFKSQNIKEEVWANMRKNTRYYIRKAEKEGVMVIKDNSDFDSFFSILQDTAIRQGYTTWPKVYFQSLFKFFDSEDLSLYFAEFEGKKVAIGLFLDYGKYRFYLEGGMLTEYSKQYPSYAIQGRSICDAIEKGIEVYDFWGGVSPKDENGETVKGYPWAGIDLYKRGFGGEEVSIVHPHDMSLNWKYWVTWGFESWERKKRGY